jgi:hypothetical protein
LHQVPGQGHTLPWGSGWPDSARVCCGVRSVPSKAKFHVTIGHATVMAEVFFFSKPVRKGEAAPAVPIDQRLADFRFDDDFVYNPELVAPPKAKDPKKALDDAAVPCPPVERGSLGLDVCAACKLSAPSWGLVNGSCAYIASTPGELGVD